MNKIEKIEIVVNALKEYYDGPEGLSINECVEEYCTYNAILLDVDEAVHLYQVEEAVSHGIPRPVAEGKAKLTDYFSQEYIDHMTGRAPAN